MDTKKRKAVTYGMIAVALCLVAWAARAMPRVRPGRLVTPESEPVVARTPEPPVTRQIPKQRPRVEVVFALDTTGSMGGLIDGAKRKIWSIAQFIAQGQPKPDLRIGLVAYRDKGDEYVTRFYDLSDDLDQVFERLSQLEAAGGGDTPEHVSKALADAVRRTSWSGDQGTSKIIYLVGDAPPHTDYQDGLDYHAIAREAHGRNIHINTIRCGADRDTQVAWNEIATAASGEYASLDQSGGVITASTPYDDRLAALNAKLTGTAIGYGSGAAGLRLKAAAATALPKSVAADRASFFGVLGGAVGGKGEDLVAAAEEGGVAGAVAAAPASSLPTEMQAMDAAGRNKYVAQKLDERKQIQAEISSIAKERNEYLRKNASKPDSFDYKIKKTLRDQVDALGGLGL